MTKDQFPWCRKNSHKAIRKDQQSKRKWVVRYELIVDSKRIINGLYT